MLHKYIITKEKYVIFATTVYKCQPITFIYNLYLNHTSTGIHTAFSYTGSSEWVLEQRSLHNPTLLPL
jgi:hypothetical protein